MPDLRPVESQSSLWRRGAPWLACAALSLWALRGFLTPLGVGSGDARWYTMMLADWISQLRAGHFPVWLGQTDFAFNGAVTPVRVAPLYQHWAGLLDLCTGEHLGFYALQNLVVVSLGIVGCCSAYAVMNRIRPDCRVLAVLCSALYLLCPGTLGLVSLFDLQMTWTAFAVLPWLVGGLWTAGRSSGAATDWGVAWPLAMLWLAHPPTGLWATILALVYLGAVALRQSWRASAARVIRCAGFGALLLAFTVAAQVSVRLPGGTNTAFASLGQPERIVRSLTEAFPACLAPLPARPESPAAIQLGYSLWILLGAGLALALKRRRPEAAVFISILLLLLLLVFPIPGFTAWSWRHFPAVVLRISGYWPMQRIYPIVAAGSSIVGYAMLSELTASTRWRRVTLAAVALGVLWSAFEADLVARQAFRRRQEAGASVRSLLPENRFLTRFAYGQFREPPPRFCDGVSQPWGEFRLLDPTSRQPGPEQFGSVVQEGWFSWSSAGAPQVRLSSATLVLQPNVDYFLQVDFPEEHLDGILQLKGDRLYREYRLPASGGPQAFGSGPGADRRIALRIGGEKADVVEIRFISESLAQAPAPWGFRLSARLPRDAGAHLEGLGPAILRVRSGADALLATPLMDIAGYQAELDDRPTPAVRLGGGELALAIPAGDHTVKIAYRAPGYLQAAYWLSAGTLAIGSLVFGTRLTLRR